MGDVTRIYWAPDVAVEWRAGLCSHCGNCKAGLPEVFDPDRRPWVDLSKATADAIREQVAQCPSGALVVATVVVEPKP